MKNILITLLLTVSSLPSLAAQKFDWPLVQEQSRTFTFNDAENARLTMNILGTDGQPLYRLHCAGLGATKDEDDIGDFNCDLSATKHPRGLTDLLNAVPWHPRLADSRGDIAAEELTGQCADYPDFGRKRVFRLRGFNLTLLFDKVETKDDSDVPGYTTLASFQLTISVKRDPSALSAIAEFSKYIFPHVKDDDKDRSLDCSHPSLLETNDTANTDTGPFTAPVHFDATVELPLKMTVDKGYDYHETTVWRESIKAQDGTHLYDFKCEIDQVADAHGHIFIRSDRLGDGNGIRCTLSVTGTHEDLFFKTTDPYSKMPRSFILPDQLHGACANYPDWGLRRVFRLRGMKLSLSFDKPLFVDPGHYTKLKSITAHLDVTPDPEAKSSVPEQAEFADWFFLPTACTKPVLNPLNNH